MAKGTRPWEDEAEIGDEPEDYEELEEILSDIEARIDSEAYEK